MQISCWKPFFLSIFIIGLFPGLWAMASENLTLHTEFLEYRRLNSPRNVQQAFRGDAASLAPRISTLQSPKGESGGSDPAPPSNMPQIPFLNAFSLMSLGLVGLVVIKRRN